MDDAPASLTLDIAVFHAVTSAVTEAEIGGEVQSVTISEIRPDLQLMGSAVAVELTVWAGAGESRPRTWIVAGDGRVVADLGAPGEDAADDSGE